MGSKFIGAGLATIALVGIESVFSALILTFCFYSIFHMWFLA